MKLSQVAAGRGTITFHDLGRDVALAKEVQRRLSLLGCLDPPADGEFGAVSKQSLARFAKHLGLPFDEAVSPKIAAALLEQKPDTFLPLRPGAGLAGRIVKYLQLKGYYIARFPNCVNIVYLEGANAQGKPNKDLLDRWNDRRMILRIDPTGKPAIVFNAVATTEPGRHFTVDPLNPGGAARIALDQFKAWRVGMHHPNASPPARHEALVQVGKIP